MKKGFRHHLFDLSAGTFIAQVLSFLAMPVISRLYLPAEMGDYALYVAISSIVGLVGNLRLDLAVVIGRDEREAQELAWAGIIGAAVTALLSLLPLGLWRGLDAFSFYTAFSIFGIGGLQTVAQWHSRRQNYRVLAKRSIGEKLIVLALGLGFGYWHYTEWGLIAAQTAGVGFAFVYFFWASELRRPPRLHWSLLETVKGFSDFPRINLISSLALAMAFFVPNILFAAFFSKDQLGFYSLINRVFEVPVNLVAYTFNTVYYQHSSKVERADRPALFLRSLKWMALLFAPPFVTVALFGVPLVRFFFGEQWAEAGTYALWLAPYTLLRMLYVSQSALLLVERRLKMEMLISLSLFAAQVGGFFAGLALGGTPLICVAVMSSISTFVYAWGLITVWRSIK